MEQLMDISHVSYSYHTMQGETPALSNINFTVHKGDFLAIVGPSGCGNGSAVETKHSIACHSPARHSLACLSPSYLKSPAATDTFPPLSRQWLP